MRLLWTLSTAAVCSTAVADKCAEKACPVSAGFSSRQKLFLKEHNYLRQKHWNTPCMKLDHKLNKHATKWAKHLLAINQMNHADGTGEGENLYYASFYDSVGWTDVKVAQHLKKAVDSWYSEIEFYDYTTAKQNPGQENKATGHFTQLVWAASTKLGLGYAYGKKDGWFTIYVVGRYSPQGNFHMSGQRYSDYSKNVQPVGCVSPGGAAGIPKSSKKKSAVANSSTKKVKYEPSKKSVVSAVKKCADKKCPVASGFSANQNIFLEQHNYLRQKHFNTPCMKMNKVLNRHATKWAKHLLAINQMNHAHGTGEGENLYYASFSDSVGWTDARVAEHVKKAVDSWYSEISFYDFATAKQNPGQEKKAVGHFTQLVWAKSTKLGLGYAYGKKDGWYTIYVVGRYSPQGNFHMSGQRYSDYSQNVQLVGCASPGGAAVVPKPAKKAAASSPIPSNQGGWNQGGWNQGNNDNSGWGNWE